MTFPAKTVFYFSFYMFALSLTLLLAPGWLAGMLGYGPDSYIWVRLIGMFLLYLAFDYFQASRENMRGFFYLTVYTRASIPAFMAVFVMLGMLKPIFLLLSMIDFSGAMLTWGALRSTSRKKRTSTSAEDESSGLSD
ncbi:hypothetical protein SAMN02799630_02270 [Paenibacillus sp. UNCCL117]|uniref:hypothetical protein n=1 Tax=unclassified Paenibacillus TaxID=185978 RepID=UPI000888C823|nr:MULTISPECIES: hypothetical protein [unclassified Paenibacillus]SDD15798.1 hypothetical protein SAMN04488602_106146 [Paenibacillus sp. cl123]SFW34538.1 hypothetical protein SAMN02799630_02270 [Paenibacillus sp. UNCCL117]